MKTFMKFLFVSVASMAIGSVLGWKAFNGQTRLRVIPFDRTQHEVIVINPESHPFFDFQFTPEGNTFNGFGKTGDIEEDLDNLLSRLANNTTSCWIVASFNRDVTVQQVRDIDARIRKFGFTGSLMLIDDNRGIEVGGEDRLFSEIRISPLLSPQ